jgi:8-oxo-dGTP diphosphatase
MVQQQFPIPETGDEFNPFFQSAFSVTAVIFGFQDKRIKVLLVKRSREPFMNQFALPAGLVYPNVEIEDRINGVIQQVTGTSHFYKKQIRAFADPTRHPMGRVISIGYYCFVNVNDCKLNSKDNLHTSSWCDLGMIPHLAFDHNEIVEAAHRRLLAKMSTQLSGLELLPDKFTLKMVQELYEASLGHELDKRNFRRKLLSQEILIETGEQQFPWEESGKAPFLYTLDKPKYDQMKADGHQFLLF